MVEAKEVQPDENQAVVIDWLDRYTQEVLDQAEGLDGYKSAYRTLFKSNSELSSKQIDGLKASYSEATSIPCVYLWGAPGSGKSFIAEQFYQRLPLEQKGFMHYQEFMLQIHE